MAGKKRNFNGMGYHEVQRDNSMNREKLTKEDKKSLKESGYKNLGWDQVIVLYQKIKELLDQSKLEELTLEELFLEADRIGNKYLSSEEREEFNQQLAKEINEVDEVIDKHFPDTENEVIDFSRKTRYKSRQKH
jgi:Holliday junction resolvasome RuvABC endonuclease subunit